MTWGWSHTQEAYYTAEANLRKEPVKFLAECWAEWRCKLIENAEAKYREGLRTTLRDVEGGHQVDLPDPPEEMTTDPYIDGRYNQFLKDAKELVKKMGKGTLADQVWGWASDESEGGANCENGGYSPWMCPEGCHTVEW